MNCNLTQELLHVSKKICTGIERLNQVATNACTKPAFKCSLSPSLLFPSLPIHADIQHYTPLIHNATTHHSCHCVLHRVRVIGGKMNLALRVSSKFESAVLPDLVGYCLLPESVQHVVVLMPQSWVCPCRRRWPKS